MRPRKGLVQRVSGVLAIAAVGTACAAIMGVEEPNRAAVDDGTSTTSDGGPVGADACVGLACPCTGDTDCRAPYAKCIDQKCAECTPSADDCPAGRHCLPSNECAPGCKASADCEQISPSAPLCNVARHQCVQCLGDDDCSGGKRCSPAGNCVEGCEDGGTCATAGTTCCGGFCVDTSMDVLNCSACGNACSTANGVPACTGSTCSWSCNPGYSHCAQGNTGCETRTANDVEHCGTCTTNCNATVANASGIGCTGGGCTYGVCTGTFADCDGQKGNGCECACPAVCTSCAGGVCSIDCGKDRCKNGVTCPPNMPCSVRCKDKDSCQGDLVCPAGQTCRVECRDGKPACNSLNIKADNSRLCIVCNKGDACNSVSCTEPPGAANDCKKVCTGKDCDKTCNNCTTVPACPP